MQIVQVLRWVPGIRGGGEDVSDHFGPCREQSVSPGDPDESWRTTALVTSECDNTAPAPACSGKGPGKHSGGYVTYWLFICAYIHSLSASIPFRKTGGLFCAGYVADAVPVPESCETWFLQSGRHNGKSRNQVTSPKSPIGAITKYCKPSDLKQHKLVTLQYGGQKSETKVSGRAAFLRRLWGDSASWPF